MNNSADAAKQHLGIGANKPIHRYKAAKDMDLPNDYEPCSECLFDHSYEPEEAYRAHQSLILEAIHQDEEE